VSATISWLTGWKYRKAHTIVGSTAGAVTDYQIRVTVHYGSGTDNGEHVYLNGRCRTDFGDVRFTSDDGTTQLAYWIEKKVDGDYAIIWVKVPSIPASPDTTTIYIYYGNPDATTTSDGDATFLFFDDFLTWDTSKWSQSQHTGTRGVSNSILTLTTTGTAQELYFSIPTFGLNAMCEMKANFVSTDGSSYTVILFCGSQVTARIGEWSQVGWGTALQWDVADTAGETHGNLGAGGYGAWYVYGAVRLPSSAKFFVNRNLVYTKSASWGTGNSQIELFSAYGSQIQIDWVLVRKYIDPEPSHGSWGSEEALKTPTTMTIEVIPL